MRKFCVAQDQYKFAYRCPREIAPNQPQYIEYLEATSQIYQSFYRKMISRFQNFPFIRFVFVTVNSPEEVRIFLNRYPDLREFYDVIYHTQ